MAWLEDISWDMCTWAKWRSRHSHAPYPGCLGVAESERSCKSACSTEGRPWRVASAGAAAATAAAGTVADAAAAAAAATASDAASGGSGGAAAAAADGIASGDGRPESRQIR